MKKLRSMLGQCRLGILLFLVFIGTLVLSLNFLFAQEFRITDFFIDSSNEVHVVYETDTNFYYILERGQAVTGMCLAPWK